MNREIEVMLQYLRNITSKVSVLISRMADLEKKVHTLAERVETLGKSCGTAFDQVRDATVKLASVTEETRLDLATYGGVIEAESFFNGC